MIVALVCILLLLLPFVAVAGPWARIELNRPLSRAHRPMAQELWLQDRTQLLYVQAVSDAGLTLLTFEPSTRQLLRWTDSWAQWGERLRVRVVTYTGRMRT
jgi:hypothetical protein